MTHPGLITTDMSPKREQILAAAYEVFSKKGYHRSTIDEIIALANTGKGTVYNYFHNKEQLFYTLVSERSLPFEAAVRQVVEGTQSPLEKIGILIRMYLEFYRKNADLWRVFMHELRGFSGKCGIPEEQRDKYRQCFKEAILLLEAVLKEGVEKKALRPCNVNQSAYCLFSVIMMMVFQNFVGTSPESVEESARMVSETFLYGVART